MGNYVEVEEFVTPGRVEWAYAKAMEAQHFRKQRFADVGWRAAKDRDPRLLKVLECAASIVSKTRLLLMNITMDLSARIFLNVQGCLFCCEI